MRICIDGKEISDFDPDFHVKPWMNQGASSKHVLGHEPPKEKVKDTA